jgi:alpha-tubulin suppressor-like RCC1 family protein
MVALVGACIAGAIGCAHDVRSDSSAKGLAFVVQPTNGAAMSPLTPAIEVELRDASDARVTTATDAVTLALGANPGGGTLGGTTTVTAVNGVATFADLSLDKAGAGYTLVASAAALTGATSTPFDIDPAAATQLVFLSPPSDALAGNNLAAVDIEIRDGGGNRMTSATNAVTLALGTNPSGGTLAGTTTVNAVNGVARFSAVSIARAGTGYTLAASAAGLTSAASSAFTITHNVASALAFAVQPTGGAAGAAIAPPVDVEIRDAYGNRVVNATTAVTVAIGTNPNGGTLSGTTAANAVNGVARFSTLSFDKAGTGYTLTASAAGLTSATSASFDITTAGATQLAFTVQPSNATAGVALAPAIEVEIRDSTANRITTATDAVTLAIGTDAGGGTLSGTVTVSAVNGIASFANVSVDKAATGYTLTAAAGSLTTATSSAFDIAPAAAAQVAFVAQPSPATAGASIAPAITVEVWDAFGNRVPSATNAVTVAIGANPVGGALSGTKVVNAASGIATFADLFLDKAGAGYTLAASAAGLTSATSVAFTVAHAAPTLLAYLVQPSNALAGDALSPSVAVELRDAFGNPATTATNDVTLAFGANPGAGTLSGTTTVNAVNGVATFANVSLNKVGTGYTLRASAGSLTAATSSAFNISPGAAAQLVFVAQPGNRMAAWTFVPSVTVAVRDAYDNLVSTAADSVTMTIGTNPGVDTLSGTKTVAAVNGVATFADLNLHKAATGYTLVASAGPLTPDTSATFDITPGPPSRLAFTIEPDSVIEGNVPFTVAVRVNDDYGNLVTSAADTVTVELLATGQFWASRTMTGTLTAVAVNGVATIPGLRVDVAGAGLQLKASAPSRTVAASTGFRIKLTFLQVATGIGTHVCGVTVSNSAYCWGSNGSGELGNGSTAADSIPRLVSGGLAFRRISVGSTFSCGLTTGDAVYCWGSNSNGRIGNGSGTASFATPQLVTTPAGRRFTDIVLGFNHACATTVDATSAPAGLYCWGGNVSGQLGDGTGTDRNAPTVVAGGAVWKRVGPGYDASCAIRSDDLAFCWGFHGQGQLGIGSGTGNFTTPQQVSTNTFAEVDGGYRHFCARRPAPADSIWCGGRNAEGQLGDGTNTQRNDEVRMLDHLTWASVSAGDRVTCMLDSSGTFTNANRHVAVSGGRAFATISAATNVCGVTATGEAWCWGPGTSGQLGNGANANSNVPVRVKQ